jgi:hypothetical protein
MSNLHTVSPGLSVSYLCDDSGEVIAVRLVLHLAAPGKHRSRNERELCLEPADMDALVRFWQEQREEAAHD